jgi:hypothetical protein
MINLILRGKQSETSFYLIHRLGAIITPYCRDCCLCLYVIFAYVFMSVLIRNCRLCKTDAMSPPFTVCRYV